MHLYIPPHLVFTTYLSEICFNNNRDSNSPPARKASVTLVYNVSDEDDLDAFSSGDVINFQRNISATGVSSYKINNKDISYESYESTLEKIGVLVKARNFLVFQGDVESVASKTPAELTKLVEQICNSNQYAEEYDTLLTQKAEAEEKAIFSLQKKKIYLTQRKEVKEQKDEAELFQDKLIELNGTKSEHILLQIWRIKEDIGEYQTHVSALKNSLDELNESDSSHDKEIESGKKELARINKLITATEKDILQSNKEMNKFIMPQLDEVRAKLKSLNKALLELRDGEAKLKKDSAEHVSEVSSLKRDIRTLQTVEDELAAEMAEASKGSFTMDEAKTKEYRKLREDVSARTASDNAQLLNIEQDVKSKHQRVLRLEEQTASAVSDVDNETRLLSEYADRSSKLTSAIADGEKEKQRLLSLRDNTSSNATKYTKILSELTQESDDIAMKIREAGEDKYKSKQEEKFNDAIETMKKIFTGVHGKLSDLFTPTQKKYVQAITVAAGKQIDAVVVDNKKIASECIRYLKDQRVGTCIFLPLDSLVQKNIPDRLRTLSPKFKLCVDLVTAGDVYRPAIAYAFGSTLVCESLQEAQDLRFSNSENVKVVTVKGHVISKNGSMTGGSTQRSDGGMDRWEEKEVDKLKKRKVEVDEKIAENKLLIPTRQFLVDLETQIKTLQTRLQFTEADLRVTKDKIAQLTKQKALLTNNFKSLTNQINEIKSDIVTQEALQSTLQSKIRKIENDVFGPFSKSLGIASIREFEEEKLAVHQTFLRKQSSISERKAALSSQLDYYLKRDFDSQLKRLGAQRDGIAAEIAKLDKQSEQFTGDKEKIARAINDLNAKKLEYDESQKKSNALLRTIQSKHLEVQNKKNEVKKKISGEEILVERARVHLHEILQKAHVDEIDLPHVDDEGSAEGSSETAGEGDDSTVAGSGRSRRSSASMSKASARTAQSSHFSQSDNPVVARDQRDAALVDLSSAAAKYNNKSKQQLGALEADLVKKITSLTNELDVVQPNMHAVKRYEGLMDKLKECNDDLDDANSVARDISARFDAVKKKRQSLFQKCFQHIYESLTTIYRDLTKSNKYPYGGNAYLTLDNTEEPYLAGIRFTAMPPMKRFRDMDQLSGGEKTIAALALLFSIHSYRQAPFFVMDEVDAALDNINVKKICNYIQKRSSSFQCIVISLKDIFFEHADSLVGVCKDASKFTSKIHTLSLKDFNKKVERLAVTDVEEQEKEEEEEVVVEPAPKQAKQRRVARA